MTGDDADRAGPGAGRRRPRRPRRRARRRSAATAAGRPRRARQAQRRRSATRRGGSSTTSPRGTVVLNDKYKPERPGAELGDGLARQADGRLRARPQPVHDGRDELRDGEEERPTTRRSSKRSSRPTASGTTASPRSGQGGQDAGRSAAGRRRHDAGRAGRPAAAARSSERRQEVRPAHALGRRVVVAGQQEVLDARAPTRARSATSGSSTRWPIRGRASRPTSTACPAKRTSRRPNCTSSTSPPRSALKLIDRRRSRTSRWRWRRRRSRTSSARSRRRASRWLSPASDKIYFNRTSRDLKRIDIVEADTMTGEPRVVVAERSNTYIETPAAAPASNGGKQLIHWSERDGWGHYYLYDIERQDRSGRSRPASSSRTGIDGRRREDARRCTSHAVGREPGEDPYFHALLPREHRHRRDQAAQSGQRVARRRSMNDKSTFFVDNSSRIDIGARVGALRRAGQQGDGPREDRRRRRCSRPASSIPEPFTVKADDGITDLYGDDVQAVRLRSVEEVPDHPVRLSRARRPRSVTKTFSPRNANVALAQRRLHRDRGRQPRRQPAAVEVVPQLRLRQPARLRRGRQEGGRRAARQAPSRGSISSASASTATRAAGS